jgi:hypothetical protein
MKRPFGFYSKGFFVSFFDWPFKIKFNHKELGFVELNG